LHQRHDIATLAISNSQPLVYELDAGLKPVRRYYLGRSAALL
jgi:bisphosphoglycerate-dependent phosphoglycerate mutase